MRLVTKTGRGSLSALVACGVLAAALAVSSASALADTSCGPPNSLSGSCFAAADGDQLDGPGDLVDWQSFTALAPIADASRGIDSKFKDGSKELEPGNWQFVVGNNTPKTDL